LREAIDRERLLINNQEDKEAINKKIAQS